MRIHSRKAVSAQGHSIHCSSPNVFPPCPCTPHRASRYILPRASGLMCYWSYSSIYFWATTTFLLSATISVPREINSTSGSKLRTELFYKTGSGVLGKVTYSVRFSVCVARIMYRVLKATLIFFQVTWVLFDFGYIKWFPQSSNLLPKLGTCLVEIMSLAEGLK